MIQFLFLFWCLEYELFLNWVKWIPVIANKNSIFT